MKEIYFVRHGESIGNASDKYQMDNSPLSTQGEEQAQQIATRATRLPIDGLISSTLVRAFQTATAISTATELAIEKSDLFVERRRPSGQRGLLRLSPEAIEMEQGFLKSSRVSGFRYSDEENFDDLTQRAEKALSFLVNHPKERLLVVTHGIFLRVLLARAVFGNELTASECGRFMDVFATYNTAVTVLTYQPEREHPWHLTAWNDHAHLG